MPKKSLIRAMCLSLGLLSATHVVADDTYKINHTIITQFSKQEIDNLLNPKTHHQINDMSFSFELNNPYTLIDNLLIQLTGTEINQNSYTDTKYTEKLNNISTYGIEINGKQVLNSILESQCLEYQTHDYKINFLKKQNCDIHLSQKPSQLKNIYYLQSPLDDDFISQDAIGSITFENLREQLSKKHHIMIYSEDVHIDIDKKIPITNKNQPLYQILQNFMMDNCLSYRKLTTDDIYIFKDSNSTCQPK